MPLPEGKIRLDQPAVYFIEVQGRLASGWTDHFSGLEVEVITTPHGYTITRLSGVLNDQPALHGVLQLVRDHNLPLLRVEFISAVE